MKYFFASSIMLAVIAVAPAQDPPKPFVAKVVKIADGDTVTVLLDKVQYRIRLAKIDAPEKKQAFGTQSKKVLGDKIFGKDVKVVWVKRDLYNRIVGDIYLDNRWINKEMIEEGWAWHYRQYSKDAALDKAEADARSARRSLWADSSPIPPWEFRKKKK